MAKKNYSAGKRQREREKERKKKAKNERLRQRQGGGEVPIASVDDIQGGMMTVDQVMQNLSSPDAEDRSARGTTPVRLFIGGLNWRTNDAGLQKKLEEFGPVQDVHVVTDRDTGDSRGFAFATMSDRRDAAQAIRNLDGKEFEGRTLVVRHATERGS